LIVSEIIGIIPEAMFVGEVRCSGKASFGSDKESLDYLVQTRNHWISWFRKGITGLFGSDKESLDYLVQTRNHWILWFRQGITGLFGSDKESLDYLVQTRNHWIKQLKRST
jgi:hypothetical protein